MNLRRLPSTLTMGLLAFLAAHATLFGADHAVGGAEQWPLLGSTLACVAGCGLFLWRLMRSAGPTVSGDRLAAHVSRYLPSAPLAFLTSAAAYGLIEACETDGHAALAWWVVLPVLAAMAWLISALAGAITRLAAHIAIRVRVAVRALRPIGRVARTTYALARSKAPDRARLFCRPPPPMQPDRLAA